ncbi:MAG: DUF6691 family protein [Gemmatimonadaceae bacterium]
MQKKSEFSQSVGLTIYFVLGTIFGFMLTKSEVVSWFRIQEMFRFQSFHMYGIIGSAVLVAAISIQLLKRLHAKSFSGESIVIPQKAMGSGARYWIGGSIFGLGWALTGACPGPLFALVGSGTAGGGGVMLLAVVSAIGGTWVYGYLRPRLPH